MNQKVRNFSRNWHRDIAYVFVGLIISFSISGIALNHRPTFNSRQYTYQTDPLQLNLTQNQDEITEDYVKSLIPEIGVANEFRTFRIQNGKLRIFLEDALAEVDLKTGEGETQFFGRRIGLAEMADLHQTTNPYWVWYSDIFGIAMIFIALSGMFISGGKTSFKRRGWYLALAGIAFPLVFLFLLA